MWQLGLIALLEIDEPVCGWNYTNKAVGGTTVANWASSIDASLATIATEQEYVLINLGVNDWMSGLPNETTWKTNYQYIINAIHAKWVGAKIYLVKPWDRGHDEDATTMAGWIDALIAANSGVVFAGHNESVWLKSDDDGWTYTWDGVHYGAAGDTECASQWETVLGY